MAPVPVPPRKTPETPGATFLADRHGRAWAVREMRGGDAAALVAYFESMSPADYANFHPHPLDRATAESVAADAGNPDALRCLLFADPACGGPVAGYGFLWDWNREVPLLGMSLAREARGRGLGAAFTRHLVLRARAAGKAAVRLTVYRGNIPAYRSYLAAGFEEMGSHPDDWGGTVREEVRMRCRLRSAGADRGPAAEEAADAGAGPEARAADGPSANPASDPMAAPLPPGNPLGDGTAATPPPRTSRLAGGPVARDGDAYRFGASGGEWALSWHPPVRPPDGTPHGANGLCVTAGGDVVLISPDGRRWGWPGGRPEGAESWEETLKREVREEACATVTEARLLGFCRSACLAGPERGLVLVRSIWWARVELLAWAPGFEIPYRRVVTAARAAAEFWTEAGAEPVYRRAFLEAGLG